MYYYGHWRCLVPHGGDAWFLWRFYSEGYFTCCYAAYSGCNQKGFWYVMTSKLVGLCCQWLPRGAAYLRYNFIRLSCLVYFSIHDFSRLFSSIQRGPIFLLLSFYFVPAFFGTSYVLEFLFTIFKNFGCTCVFFGICNHNILEFRKKRPTSILL